MATKGRQRLEVDGNFSIEIIPDGIAGAHGTVLDGVGKLIAPWSFSGIGEVWINVGAHKGGRITEGLDENAWIIIDIG
jgi:hypothetical protein